MSADFTFDRKAFAKFQNFVTNKLESEIEKAYARTFRLLGAGSVRHVTRTLKTRPEHKSMLDAGIDFGPRNAGRIQQLKPMRIAIGVNDSRQKRRDRRQLTSPIGKPFVAHQMDNPFTGTIYRTVLLQRYGAPRVAKWTYGQKRQRLHLIAIGEEKIRSYSTFKYLVTEFVSNNHDKIFERQYRAAVERAAK